jgi:sRNA-binding regulator protein Hfq
MQFTFVLYLKTILLSELIQRAKYKLLLFFVNGIAVFASLVIQNFEFTLNKGDKVFILVFAISTIFFSFVFMHIHSNFKDIQTKENFKITE